jgi:hypothetical protein
MKSPPTGFSPKPLILTPLQQLTHNVRMTSNFIAAGRFRFVRFTVYRGVRFDVSGRT